MRRSMRIAVGVAAGVLVLATSAAAEAPMTTAFVKRATQSSEPRTTIVPAATSDLPPPSEGELALLSGLAHQEGISLEEAVAKYGWQEELGKVVDELQRKHHSFTEAAIEEGDGYSARISFAGDVSPDVAAALAAAKLPIPVQIRDRMAWTEAEIVDAMERVYVAIPDELKSDSTGDPGMETGEIRIELTPAAGLSVDEARTRIYQAATTDGPLRDAIDQVPPTVSLVITVVSYPLGGDD